MKDGFGRTIDYLRLSVTDRCNLRCRYCMPEEGVAPLAHGEILSYEELLRVAAAAVRLGVKKIRVTGGEPLVRKGICDFIRHLSALPGHPQIVLTTNGLRLGEMAEDLKAAGLARVNVSLDSLKEECFAAITRRQGLDAVLEGLRAAERFGLLPLKINMVPIRGVNHEEIVDFARLTLDHPWEIRFIEYMPVNENQEFVPEQRFPAADILAELSRIGNLIPIPRVGPAGPARLFRYSSAQGRLGVIPAVSSHFCGECNRLRVTADGRIRPCLFSDHEIDLRQALRSTGGDQLLEQTIADAIGAKPEKHLINGADFQPQGRNMQGIGG